MLLINAAQLCVCKNKTCLCLPSMRLSSLSICSSVATRVSCFGKARPSESADILSVCCSLRCFYRGLTFRIGVVEKATAPTRGYRAKHVSQLARDSSGMQLFSEKCNLCCDPKVQCVQDAVACAGCATCAMCLLAMQASGRSNVVTHANAPST